MPPDPPRLYLALALPLLPLHALAEQGPGPDESPAAPVVFVERVANAMRLTAVSPIAMGAGLAPGLSLADARARVPGIVAMDRDHAAEAALLGRLLAGLVRYTPMAAAEPPDGLLLDITGCTGPYGGGDGLRTDACRRLARAGIAVRAATGPTPQAARALARFGRAGGDVRALPVAALEAPPEVTLALRRAGLVTIADLACRPRAALAARFGDLPLRLARVLGEEDPRITPHRPPPPIATVRRFAEPVARTEHALQVLAELVGEAAVTLGERHEGGRRFEARFFRSDGRIFPLTVETGRPTRDPAMLDRLFCERIEAIRDPIDPGFGFDLIRLDVPVTETLAPLSPGLADPPRQQEAIGPLIDRLAARLGADRLTRLAPGDSHVPERAALRRAACADPATWPLPDAAEGADPPLRPLMVYDPPEAVIVTAAGLPDGPPRAFRWGRAEHRVRLAEGPERIAPEWWRRRTTTGRTRDYWRVEDEAGRRFWLFRSGLPGDPADPPCWYVHGRFA